MTQRDDAERLATRLIAMHSSGDGRDAAVMLRSMAVEIELLNFTIGALEGTLTSLEDKDKEIERLKIVISGYKADQLEGIEISVKQQAEIERLNAELDEWRFTNKIDEMYRGLERKDALLRDADQLCGWISETPHQRGSINGKASQLGYAIKTELGE